MEGSDSVPAKTPKKTSRIRRDVEEMMFGFGDQWKPNEQSVELMELIVKQYIADICIQAKAVSELTGKLDEDCFLFLVRKDRRKWERLKQLINVNDELQRAKNLDLNPDV